MPVVTAHESRGTFSPWPISLAIAIGLLVVGLVLLAALFSIGLSIRPANYPDIGVAVNVGSGYSLGLGLVVESSYPWGSRLALGICAFWAYVVLTLFFLFAAPVEWALRRKRNRS